MSSQSIPTACACCLAAMLANPRAATAAAASMTSAVNSKARALSAEQQPILGYQPKNFVEDVAVLDLDHRSILARLSMETEDGLAEAQEIYVSGRKDVLGYGELTIKDLSAKAGVDLVGSLTYATFEEYYGKSEYNDLAPTAEYADIWVQAAFDGGATTSFRSGKDFDFSSFGLEGRAGKL